MLYNHFRKTANINVETLNYQNIKLHMSVRQTRYQVA